MEVVVLMSSYRRLHSCTHAKECSAGKTLHAQIRLPVQKQEVRAFQSNCLVFTTIFPAYGYEGKKRILTLPSKSKGAQ